MNQMETGRFIASLRKESGLTQQALGEEFGVTNKTISRWENGVYMPDIEMLKLLSQKFHVSINELLCGERLNDADFRKEADDNTIAVSKESAFSMKERFNFWKSKWMKDHIALILFGILFCMGLLIIAWIRQIVWLVGASLFLWLVVYLALRNKMMIYIENRIYGQPNKRTEET